MERELSSLNGKWDPAREKGNAIYIRAHVLSRMEGHLGHGIVGMGTALPARTLVTVIRLR